MVRNLQILPEIPPVPANSGMKLVAVSYEISFSPYFETTGVNKRDEKAIIVSNIEDNVNLTSYYYDVEGVTEDTDIYARYRLHFEIATAGGVRTASTGWSTVVNMKGDQEGFKVADVILATPIVGVRKDTDNQNRELVVITSSKMKLFVGYGNHKSTTWVIEDSDGQVIFERLRSEELLEEIRVPLDTFEFDKAYVVKCQHHSTTNADSYWGKEVYNQSLTYAGLYEILIHGDLVGGKTLPLEVVLHMNKFESVDYVLKDKNGTIVAKSLDNSKLYTYMYIPELTPGQLYCLYSRLEYLEGVYTPWRKEQCFILKERTPIEINPNIKYEEEYKFVQHMIQPYTKYLYSQQLDIGGFIMATNQPGAFHGLAMYQLEGGRLEFVNNLVGSQNPHASFDLSGWSISVMPIFTGEVVINRMEITATHDAEGIGDTIFMKYAVNRSDRTFTLKDVYRPLKQLGSTGVSGSIAATIDSSIWYIPHLEGTTKNHTNLKLYRLNTVTMANDKEIDLPFNAKTYVSLCIVRNDILLVAGGMKEVPSGDTKAWTRDNDLIYLYNTKTDEWRLIANFNSIGLKSWYNLHMVTRADGNVAIFNNTESAGVAEDQSIVILNTYTNTLSKLDNDFPDGRMYLKTLFTDKRDIYRSSSSPLDPQLVFKHVRKGLNEVEYTTDDYIDHVITNLVVPANTTVTIDNPYKYARIEIQGKVSDGTSGKLIWLGKNNRREFFSDTLFITKTMQLYENNVDELTKDDKWKNVVVLEGAELQITDANAPTGTPSPADLP